MEFQIMYAKLNAEYAKKTNELSARKQATESIKHDKLEAVDDRYHNQKRDYLLAIAEIRKKKEGLPLDHPRRADLTDEIRNIEDKLNLLRDERDIEARRVVGETFAAMIALENESRHINEWLEDEKIKIMEAQLARKKELEGHIEQ